MNTVDLRKASVLAPGQEVLTADNVALKLSLLVTHQVADPVKAAHETQNWAGDIYNAALLALRAVINAVTVEALLAQRLDVGAQLLARVQPEAAKIGVNVLALEVKDVMFPADLAAAVQLRLRVASGLQTFTVKSRLLTGENAMQFRGNPPISTLP